MDLPERQAQPDSKFRTRCLVGELLDEMGSIGPSKLTFAVHEGIVSFLR